ncbi:unnamed protein product [marine sediment metagenome]|uniref:Uncharacterized protein n=2 Tax=marine sediment metagenome TaxID=412755 RepID=X1F7W5_9ZZZZ
MEKPEVIFKEINPTKYEIEIKDAKHPYFLVLSENFNKNWKIYLNKKSLPENEHYIINGFANSWLIKEKGSYNLIIEYMPQKYMNFGILISSLTLFFSISFLFYDFIIGKKGNRVNK